MKIYDKAQWHIDGGESPDAVISKFQSVFAFLDRSNMLSTDGREIFEFGTDGSVSLNERLVNGLGRAFLEKYYDDVINLPADKICNVPPRQRIYARQSH